MFNITDTKVSNILLNIAEVLTSENCNYFESLEALSMSSSERSSIAMTLSVAVPAARRLPEPESPAAVIFEKKKNLIG